MTASNFARTATPLAVARRGSAAAAELLAFALLALIAAAGCDPGDEYVDVGDKRNRTRDGGATDGAIGGDGAVGQGDGAVGQGDGGVGSGNGDGGLGSGNGDGGAGDEDGGSEPEIDVSNCTLSDEADFDIAVPFSDGGFAIAPGHLDVGLAYRHTSDTSCTDAIETVMVDSSGAELADPVTVLDDCKTRRELALGSSADGWHMAWTDNSTNAIELHTAPLTDTLELPSADARSAITTSPMAVERRPQIANFAGEAIVAWFSEDADDERSIWTKPLASGGEPNELVPGGAGHLPVELAIAQIGPEQGALAWVEEVANRGIWLQPLDSSGQAVGSARRLTDFAAPGSTVDLATREDDGGAAIYSIGIDQVNFEVRFRRLAADASFRGDEIKVISRPLQAKDAGIARLGGGYAIAYRAIPDGGVIKDPQIRLVFASKEGNLSRDAQGRVITFPVVPAARDGSRVQVKVSVDGQMLIAFVDGSDSAENTLRLVRRRLDCGL